MRSQRNAAAAVLFFWYLFPGGRIVTCREATAKWATVVLDVGANAEIYSLAALAVQPNAIVHAFEPTPEIAARLRVTAKLNGLENLFVHEVAVSSKNGAAILKRFRGDLGTNEGVNFISEDLSILTAKVCKQFASISFARIIRSTKPGKRLNLGEGARLVVQSE
jgi:FkbM family methyltransferase